MREGMCNRACWNSATEWMAGASPAMTTVGMTKVGVSASSNYAHRRRILHKRPRQRVRSNVVDRDAHDPPNPLRWRVDVHRLQPGGFSNKLAGALSAPFEQDIDDEAAHAKIEVLLLAREERLQPREPLRL